MKFKKDDKVLITFWEEILHGIVVEDQTNAFVSVKLSEDGFNRAHFFHEASLTKAEN